MPISVADNFSYKGSKPLDARVKYSTVADMKDATASDLYDGCFAYVTATKKYYSYDSSNTVDETTGKWREYSSGGSGASSLSDLTDTAISSPSNGQALRYNETSGKWENADISEGGNAWTDVTGTLTAGSTSLTLTDSAITTDALYDFYTSVFGLHPTGATVSTGSIVLTFEEQSSNVSVTVRVYDPNATGSSSGGGHVIEDNGTELTQRDTLNLIGFDAEDDSQNEKTQVSAHRLTSSEMEEIFSVGLPGAITGFDLSNTSNEANIHSTDERVIGQWTDGKPLYQKTIQTTIVVDTNGQITETPTDVASLNIDSLILLKGATNAVNLPSVIWNSAETYPYIIRLYHNSANHTIVTAANRKANDGNTLYITLQYTKSTDTAVSSGEKIVGQWIDGKPIFEKVFEGNIGSTAVSGLYVFTPSLDNSVDKVIDITGYLDNGGSLNQAWTNNDAGGDTTYFCYCNTDYTNHKLRLATNRSTWAGVGAHIVARYTKS